MNHRRTRPALIALAGLPLALALVGCGSDEDPGDASPAAGSTSQTSTAPSTPSAPSTSPATSAPSAPSTTQPSSAAPTDDALLAAVSTALGASEGTVFSIDLDDGGWDVGVVATDGTESDLTVSADGTQVTRGPVPDTDDSDDSDDSDDLAERQALLRDATVTLESALATARTEVPDGVVDGLDLDLERGRATWDVQLDEDTADEQTVVVDAVTGELVRVERDD